MIRRETDIEYINRVANSPCVRPFIDYRDETAPMDFTPTVGRVAETGIVWLSDGEDALGCFVSTGEREWQVHVMFGIRCRGAKALATARAMLDYMRPYADRMWAAIPLRHKPLRWVARQVGFVRDHLDNFEAEGPVEIAVLAS